MLGVALGEKAPAKEEAERGVGDGGVGSGNGGGAAGLRIKTRGEFVGAQPKF